MSAELRAGCLEGLYDLLHHGVDLVVVECLLVVLQGDGYAVALLARGEVLPFVDVEEGYSLEQFALGFAHGLGYALESDGGVDEQSQVSANGLCLGQRRIGDLMGGDELEEGIPVDRGIDHTLLYPEAF